MKGTLPLAERKHFWLFFKHKLKLAAGKKLPSENILAFFKILFVDDYSMQLC